MENLNDESIRKNYAENCDILRNLTEFHTNDIDLQQDLQDEYLAILLQNEEFLNCLKTDKDFMNALSNEVLNEKTFNNFDYKPSQDIDYSYGKGK